MISTLVYRIDAGKKLGWQMQDTTALRTGDNGLIGPERQACLRSHLHMASHANLMFQSHDSLRILVLEQALVSLE